ncbi:hypothetical protein PGT21_006122 [Puccinia graminis f. sp. tritici]|uniref:Uncharacterized protein n=1 Tax=Puccinia graminis f. sp. tritici TaxID=56615 RepID=A0A5B0QEJ2_PUCGR|nr:hypothetical protein PGT21_006122 [Puccinia graminis f. sp. tritici]
MASAKGRNQRAVTHPESLLRPLRGRVFVIHYKFQATLTALLVHERVGRIYKRFIKRLHEIAQSSVDEASTGSRVEN